MNKGYTIIQYKNNKTNITKKKKKDYINMYIKAQIIKSIIIIFI